MTQQYREQRRGGGTSPIMRSHSRDESVNKFRPLSPSIITGAEFDQLSLGPHASKNVSCNNSATGSASIDELDLSNEDIDELVGMSLSVFSQTPSSTLLPPLQETRSKDIIPPSFIFSKSQEPIPKVTGYRAISPKQYVIDEQTVVKDRKYRGKSEHSRHAMDHKRPLSPLEFHDFASLSNQPSVSKVSLSIVEDGPMMEQYEATSSSSFKPFRSKPLLRNTPRTSMQTKDGIQLAPLVSRPSDLFDHNGSNTAGDMAMASNSFDVIGPSGSFLEKFEEEVDRHPSLDIDLGSRQLNASQALDFDLSRSQLLQQQSSNQTDSPTPQLSKMIKSSNSPPKLSYTVDSSFDDNNSISSSITDMKHLFTYSLADRDEATLPFQVHRRILGWKITSVQRRKDLVDMLDIMTNPDDPHLKLRMGTLSPSVKNGLSHLKDQTSLPMREEVARLRKVSYRQSESMEKFLSRSLKTRQSYSSVNAIKGLMEEKRKTLRTRDEAIIAGELLPNLSQRFSSSQNIHQTSLTSNDQSGIQVDEDTFLKMVSRSFFEEEDMEEISRNLLGTRPKSTGKGSKHINGRAKSPAQQVYNFPVNLHRPRDRMVSVSFSSQVPFSSSSFFEIRISFKQFSCERKWKRSCLKIMKLKKI